MEKLIEKAKNGDKEAFTELIYGIRHDLYKIARCRLSCEDDIEDAIQETMIKTFKYIKRLNKNESFKTWIITILINNCNTIYKKYKDRNISFESLELERTYQKKPAIKVNDDNYQKYSKIIDNINLELNIPSEWKYKEIPQNLDNDFYKYALKLYKNSEEQYAMLYFYNDLFGVCGTGRESEKIILDNGKEATIGYYDGNRNWSDISFYNLNKNIAILLILLCFLFWLFFIRYYCFITDNFF